MEKDRHKYGFHCAGLKRAFFHFSPGLQGREAPQTPTDHQFLLHYADEIAKCEEFASAEFGPCSCLPCPQ